MPSPVKTILHHDTVLQVTNALPPTLQRRFVTKSIVSQTREALRLVQTKVALGSLGKHDRQETRAAVLLDYVLRKQQQQQSSNNHNNSIAQPQETIDLKHLAAVNGTKLVHFQSLHQTLGNYFHDIYHKNSSISNNNNTFGASAHDNTTKQRKSNTNSGNIRSTTNTTGKQARSACGDGIHGNDGRTRNSRHASHNRSNNNNNNAVVATQTILPDLSIRLAGYLQNPHAVTVQAARLLHNMRDYSSSHDSSSQQQRLSAVERRGQEYDYVRYWSAYEAAAFFVVATTWQNALHHHHHHHQHHHVGSPFSMTTSSSTSSTTRRRASSKNNKSGADSTSLAAAAAGGVLVATGDDEDDSRGGVGQQQQLQLRLEHLVAACKNHFTLLELKEKLPHVQKMAVLVAQAQVLDAQKQQQERQQQQREHDNNFLPPPPTKRARLGLGATTGALARTNPKANTARRDDAIHASNVNGNPKRKMGDSHGGNNSLDNDHDGDDGHDDDENAVLTLDRWAACILSEARARVQNAEKGNPTAETNGMKNGHGHGDSLEQLEELWTRIAADQVLQKYKLLDQEQK
jgi:hypothetical protein